ncbi:MAG: hypothetical protein U0V49_09705 [Saprospiraceae bacterium]
MKLITNSIKSLNMQNNALVLAFILVLGHQSVKAQYDDVYYDPGKVYNKNEDTPPVSEPTYSYSSKNYNPQYDQSETGYDTTEYDDATLNDEDYDYYYSSRIRRFHHNYYAPDFYDPFYADAFYYDPYYDPYMVRDIYAYSGGYRDYWYYRRWHNWYTFHPSYWNSWNWYYGYNPFGPVWTFNNFYNPWYYNYYSGWYDPWYGYGYGWGGRCGWYDRSRYGWYNYGNHNGHYASNNPKGTYYGSRRGGLTHTSKYGPVRLGNDNPSKGGLDRSTGWTPDRQRNDRVINRPEKQDGFKPAPDRNANPDSRQYRNPDQQGGRPDFRPDRSERFRKSDQNQGTSPERKRQNYSEPSQQNNQSINPTPSRSESMPSQPRKRSFGGLFGSSEGSTSAGEHSAPGQHSQVREFRSSPKRESSFGGGNSGGFSPSSSRGSSGRSFGGGSGGSHGASFGGRRR